MTAQALLAAAAVAAVATLASAAPPPLVPGGPCNTAADCSLNGDCVNSRCACDPWWSASPSCDVLALLPADKAAGYHNSTQSSWGGVPLRDPADGTWVLHVAQMAEGCGLMSWKNNSLIARARSASGPGGPYTFEAPVLPPFSHNPKVVAANGTVFMFGIGGGMWRTTPQECSASAAAVYGLDAAADAAPGSPTGDGCGPEPPLNGGCGIFVASAPSLAGPWSAPQPVVMQNRAASPLLNCTFTNPSVVVLPNGTSIMAFNAGWCNHHLETIGLATAPHPLGPWSLRSLAPIFTDAGVPHQCEDPFIYRTARGWHILVHNQANDNVAAYAHSEDLDTWTLHVASAGPYNRTIVWSDGTSDTLEVERPQFVFDPATGAPTHLINGALYPNGSSFTLFRPLYGALAGGAA